MKYFYPLLIIMFATSGCDVSYLSNKKITDISRIKVIISIKDIPGTDKLENTTVYLTDGKKQIINKQLKIRLNNKNLDLYTTKELYYKTKSYYKIDDVYKTDSYYFDIILSDSTTHPLAFIKPMKQINLNNIIIPDKILPNQDFIIKWKELNDLNKLSVREGVQPEKLSETTINSKKGQYIIPKSHFQDSITNINYLNITFSGLKEGLINPKLLTGSKIEYSMQYEKIVDINR